MTVNREHLAPDGQVFLRRCQRARQRARNKAKENSEQDAKATWNANSFYHCPVLLRRPFTDNLESIVFFGVQQFDRFFAAHDIKGLEHLIFGK